MDAALNISSNVEVIQSIEENLNWAWWCIPVIPDLRKLRQGDYKLGDTLRYMERLSLKKSIINGRICIDYM